MANTQNTDLQDDDFANRDALAGVDALFVTRWSPRAFDKSEIEDATIARLVDAARWSPSCFNEQPWRFYTSTPETFADYLDLLVEGNQAWAANAGVIGFLAGKTRFDRNGNNNDSFALDCGAAWMALTLQARIEGLYTHGMAGIKHEAVQAYLGLDPADERVLMGFAIGRRGDKKQLDAALQEREAPSGRRALAEIWRRGAG